MGTASGELIIKAREMKGLSASELARKVGVTRGFISLLEKDATSVSEDRLKAVAEVLGVSLSDLGYHGAEKPMSNPEWLKFLCMKYTLSDDDKRELIKIVDRVGIPQNLPDETLKEFRLRWVKFYQTVSIFLPNASTKMLQHPDVQPFMRCMGFNENSNLSWDIVFDKFDALVEDRLSDVALPLQGKGWLELVCSRLSIIQDEKLSMEGVDKSRQLEILTMRSFVQCSNRIYGAVLKDKTDYTYIKNTGDVLFGRGDFPIWHEVVRVLIDPELSVKSGAFYHPDGEDRPPLEFVISRLAARLACWPFQKDFKKISNNITPVIIEDYIKKVYPELPWRVAFVGLLDFCDIPYLYADCYLRLKRVELKEKKIRMEDVGAMAKDSNSKLRVGFVFRNRAAEKTSFELRHNLRIADCSVIKKAWSADDNKVIRGVDDLSDWDVGYDLKGRANVSAVRQKGFFGEPHVRAIMKVLSPEEDNK